MYEEQLTGWGATLWRSAGGAAEPIAADGSADLILRGDALWLAGPSTRFLLGTADAGVPTAGVRLAPGSAAALLGIRPDEVRDALLDPKDVLAPAQASELGRWRDWLAAARDTPRLADALPAAPPIAPGRGGELALARELRWAATVRRAASQTLPVAGAAAALGRSERQFRRDMTARFGYGYAALTMIVRAQAALRLIDAGHPLAEAAARAGYADQPHLSRDFARLVGRRPRALAGYASGRAANRSIELPSGSSTVA